MHKKWHLSTWMNEPNTFYYISVSIHVSYTCIFHVKQQL
jgi:hypothetical protein